MTGVIYMIAGYQCRPVFQYQFRPLMKDHRAADGGFCIILYENSINANGFQFYQQETSIFNLLIIDDCIDCNIDFYAKGMRIIAEASDILDTIPGGCTGSKARGTDINSVGTVVDSRNAALQILCRCK